MDDFLPYALPDIAEEEVEAVSQTLRSGWVTSGPAAKAFEEEFASFMGGEVEAVSVNSATAGLHLALEACGISEGDEVIVPTWTFTATAEVVRYLGAVPVIVDVDRETLNIDMEAVTQAITPATRAIIVVHFAGLSVDMVALNHILDGRDIRVIEDAAHALPCMGAGVRVGYAEYSDAAIFSFYANKTMTTGDGGMVCTRRPEIAKRVRTMRLHGIDRDVFDRYRSTSAKWAYDVVAPGYKYNLSDPAAALGRVQLRKLEAMRGRRQEIAEEYQRSLSGLDLRLPSRGGVDSVHAWHLFVVRLPTEAAEGRDAFIEKLAERRIGCSVHFIPLHQHSYWRNSLNLNDADFPVASEEFKRVVSLPIYSRMTDQDVGRVVAAVREVLEA